MSLGRPATAHSSRLSLHSKLMSTVPCRVSGPAYFCHDLRTLPLTPSAARTISMSTLCRYLLQLGGDLTA